MVTRSRSSKTSLATAFLCLGLLGGLGTPTAAVSATVAGERGCWEGPARLCLLGRFQVEASWWDGSGREQVALALPLASPGTGAFALFGGENADLLLRVSGNAEGASPIVIEAGALADAAFELRVRDTRTGAEWTHRNPRGQVASVRDSMPFAGNRAEATTAVSAEAAAGREPARTVADLLEAGGPSLESEPTETENRCLESPTDLCFLGGRIRARARFRSGDRQGEAWVTEKTGETGLFSATARGAAALAVRVVDGRAVNGKFWLLYSALAAEEVEIELVDLATGNRRLFVKESGSAVSVADTEALSASAAVVNVTLEPTRAVTGKIGPLGGVLEATDGHGTKFRLAVPKNALYGNLDVTLTPVTAIGALPFTGGLRGAVYIEPEGFFLSESALLTITPNPALPPAQQLTFSFRGLAGELFLSAPLPGQAQVVVPVHRLGGFGLGAGTAADLTAQLARLPTRPDDGLLQRLAGLILPQRRSGALTAPAPPAVLQLLQQEFTASVKPKLAAMRLGSLDETYPSVRNWLNAAKDAGQAAKLAAPLKEIKAAEIAGAVKTFELAAKSSVDDAAKPAPKPCKSVKAAGMLYRAYRLVSSHGAQRQVRQDELLRCARFELIFDTVIDGLVRQDVTVHDEAQVRFPLVLDIAKGSFLGGGAVEQRVAKVNGPPECTITRKGPDQQARFVVPELTVRSFYWRESPAWVSPILEFEFNPSSSVGWLMVCPPRPPPAPGVPGFPGSITTFGTTWSGTYNFLHLDERVGRYYVLKLSPSFRPGVWAQTSYERAPYPPYYSEDTEFLLLFSPK